MTSAPFAAESFLGSTQRSLSSCGRHPRADGLVAGSSFLLCSCRCVSLLTERAALPAITAAMVPVEKSGPGSV